MIRTPRWRVVLLATATLSLTTVATREARAQRADAGHLEWLPAGGLHFLGPQRASLALGALGILRGGNSNYGVLALVEPGLGGAKIRAGLASVSAFITGWEIQGAALRTFGSPAQGDRWKTYAGGELHVMFVVLNVGVGAYTPVGGGKALTAFMVGLGL
jgi:hypothetical protein